MTRFFVICQGGFGVIERIREEIDFGKKITFTVNHCDHVILTWIFFKLILKEWHEKLYIFWNSQIGVNICIWFWNSSPQNYLKFRSHAFFPELAHFFSQKFWKISKFDVQYLKFNFSLNFEPSQNFLTEKVRHCRKNMWSRAIIISVSR